MRVVGTAGHVDHGKSTLVRALTGIDPDRLQEEKARGMTIDLGFAWVDLHWESTQESDRADKRAQATPVAPPRPAQPAESSEPGESSESVEPISVGIVDVPGHIDFIKNMLAGVGGIDAAILVVAADEGVMPQTLEHLAILDLLQVPRCLVALTKVDLVDEPEWLDLVELDIEALLEQTHFAGLDEPTPIVRVSARTGQGLATLRQSLRQILTRMSPRRNRNRPRLPVDRVFTLSGFGPVVTGTLLDGAFAVGNDVAVYPGARAARVRGMQSHQQALESAQPGARVALNLAGIGVHELHRGDVVAQPGGLETTNLIDVQFRLLPGVQRPLRHNQRVDFFCGAADYSARVRLLGTDRLEPGEQGWLQLRFEQQVPLVAGDRFILRRPSPSQTIGGGKILHGQPGRRWKRFDPAVTARFEQLNRGAPDELLLDAAARQPLLNQIALVAAATIDADIGAETVAQMEESGALATVQVGNETLYATLEWVSTLERRALEFLAAYHAHRPLRLAMPLGELRARLNRLADDKLTTRVMATLLTKWQEKGLARMTESGVALANFSPEPTPKQSDAIRRLEGQLARSPYTPPNETEVLALLDQDEELLAYLVECGVLVRLSQGVVFQSHVFESMVEGIIELMSEGGGVTLAQVRDHFGTSRRYAQAILEEMDTRRITRREEDVRFLRAVPGG